MPTGVPTNRSNITLPAEMGREILAKMQTESAVMQLARQITLPGNGVTIPVITGDPTAGWVGETDARPATVYEPQKPQEARKAQQLQSSHITTFLITPGLGQEYALRFRYKNTTGQPVTARLRLTDSKNTVLVDREISFPPTPDKFKMLSTTTGTQINAGSYRLTIEADGLTFKNLEIQ